ncbi:hypothetical protein [Glycomyces sp. YM15]|uniref:hypothetical protein n=1 Tax=Glycomyces sp. YM15 TaxID=2800446 RepID=UPI001964FD70|nr:hypothetical protein [Glycomyces sp. YM15]
MTLTVNRTTEELHRLHDAVMNRLADLAPWPSTADAATGRAVVDWHAAQGSAKHWMRGVALDTDHDWALQLDTEAHQHYTVAGLLSYLAGHASTDAADTAARSLYAAPAGTDAAVHLLDAVRVELGDDASEQAASVLAAETSDGSWSFNLGRAAKAYNVGYWIVLDDAKADAGITW